MKTDDTMRILVEHEGAKDEVRKQFYGRIPFMTLESFDQAQVVAVIVIDQDDNESIAMLVGRTKELMVANTMLRLLEDLTATVRATRDTLLGKLS